MTRVEVDELRGKPTGNFGQRYDYPDTRWGVAVHFDESEKVNFINGNRFEFAGQSVETDQPFDETYRLVQKAFASDRPHGWQLEAGEDRLRYVIVSEKDWVVEEDFHEREITDTWVAKIKINGVSYGDSPSSVEQKLGFPTRWAPCGAWAAGTYLDPLNPKERIRVTFFQGKAISISGSVLEVEGAGEFRRGTSLAEYRKAVPREWTALRAGGSDPVYSFTLTKYKE